VPDFAEGSLLPMSGSASSIPALALPATPRATAAVMVRARRRENTLRAGR
jgi:hypothetical protein